MGKKTALVRVMDGAERFGFGITFALLLRRGTALRKGKVSITGIDRLQLDSRAKAFRRSGAAVGFLASA